MKQSNLNWLSAIFGETIDEPLYYEGRVGWKNVIFEFFLGLALSIVSVAFLIWLFGPVVGSLIHGHWLMPLIIIVLFVLMGWWLLAGLVGVFIWGFIASAIIDAGNIIHASGVKLPLDQSGMTYYENKASHFKAWDEIDDIDYYNFPTKKEKFNRHLAVKFNDGTLYQLQVSNTKEFKAKFENFWLVYRK